MRKLVLISLAVVTAGVASAAPLFVQLGSGPHFNVGAWNQTGPTPWDINGKEWDTFGPNPDRLQFSHEQVGPQGGPGDHEVTAFWGDWWNTTPIPVFGSDGGFGGDFFLDLAWFGQDAPYVGGPSTIDVSLNGAGIPGAPALEIWGRLGAPTAPMQLLWAQNVYVASLYGYSSGASFTMEGLGTVVGGALAGNAIGHQGGFRGSIDFWEPASVLSAWIPPMYNPVGGGGVPPLQRWANFSGEVGRAVPEPGSMIALGAGLAALLARRKTKKS